MNFAAVSFQRDDDALWAVNHGLSVRIPEPIAARLNGHAGRAATLGIRPEDLHIAGAADDAGHCFDAQVEVVERLGSEILLDVSVGPSTMVASVPPTVRTRITRPCAWRSPRSACTSSTPSPRRRPAGPGPVPNRTAV